MKSLKINQKTIRGTNLDMPKIEKTVTISPYEMRAKRQRVPRGKCILKGH